MAITKNLDLDGFLNQFADKICERYFSTDELSKKYPLGDNREEITVKQAMLNTLMKNKLEGYGYSFLSLVTDADIIRNKAKESGIGLGELFYKNRMSPERDNEALQTIDNPGDKTERIRGKMWQQVNIALNNEEADKLQGFKKITDLFYGENRRPLEIFHILEQELLKAKNNSQILEKSPVTKKDISAMATNGKEAPEDITTENLAQRIISRLETELFSERQLSVHTHIPTVIANPKASDAAVALYDDRIDPNRLKKDYANPQRWSVFEGLPTKLADALTPFMTAHLLSSVGINCDKEKTQLMTGFKAMNSETELGVEWRILSTLEKMDKDKNPGEASFLDFKNGQKFEKGELAHFISKIATEELNEMIVAKAQYQVRN